MKTLFLHPPSFDGFDGGAGARYQMKREVRSFWYPTWLAQPAALVEGSKLIDAPPHDLSFEDIVPELKNRELVVMHTSTPSFKADVKTAEMIKAINPGVKIGFIGAKVAVEPEKSLIAGRAVDFVARNEFDFTIKEVADGMDWSGIKGLSYRNAEGVIVHNEDRAVLENMDSLPWVTPVYKRDLDVEKYFGGYLKHPYISFYTGRGCKSRCTFCLWPQTVGGHRYRVRSVENVVEEMKWAKNAFPQVKEFFFDDDTLTDNLPRVEALAKELGKLGVTWSCNAKANVPRKTLGSHEGKRLAAAAGRLRIRQSANLDQYQEGHARGFCASLHQGLSRVGNRHPWHLYSRSARARPRRRSSRRWISPRRSIRIRFRFRWRRLIRGHSCTGRQRKTAGSITRRSIF